MGLVLEGETKVLRRGFFDVQNRVGVGRDEDDYHQASHAQFTGLRRLETESGGETIRGSALPSVGTMLACPDPSKDVQSSGLEAYPTIHAAVVYCRVRAYRPMLW